MTASIPGYATFPGVNQVRRCRYTRSLGTLPDVAVLEMLPQPNTIAAGGTLAFHFGTDSVLFPGCRIDLASMQFTKAGQVVSVRIFDRRWSWTHRQITGRYNVRFADGDLDERTEQAPQQLAARLFQALGESVFDVSALPNFDRPEVDWLYNNAAHELSRLCEHRGCRVALGLDNIPRIVRIGAGATLPTTDVRSVSYGVNPPERPRTLLFVGGEIRFQFKLLLEAVGEDTDGRIVPIGDLSYLPAGGWELQDPEDLLPDSDALERTLALKSVYRWYRVKAHADGTLDFPVFGLVDAIHQILPVSERLLEEYTDEDDNDRPHAAFVEGVYWTDGDVQPERNTDDGTLLDLPFSLDPHHGLVRFGRPVFRMESNEFKPAELHMVGTVSIEDPDTRQKVHFTRERVIDPTGLGTAVIRRDDVVRTIRITYSDSSPTQWVSSVDNETEVIAEANAHLDAAEANFQTVESFDVEYRGIKRLSTDGAVRQVTWEVDMQRGHRTWASRNNETEYGVLRYPERRRLETTAAEASPAALAAGVGGLGAAVIARRKDEKGHA